MDVATPDGDHDEIRRAARGHDDAEEIMKWLVALILGFALWVATPTGLFASEPVHAVITGCVRAGVFMSESTNFGTHVSPGGYRINLLFAPGSPVDLGALEGRRIMVTGELLPGDTFFVEEETLIDRGPCDAFRSGDGASGDWMPGDASGEGTKFIDPLVNGVPLDYCLDWGSACGKPAADAWCRAQGYAEASTFEVRGASPPTRIFSSGRICDMVFCDRIISLTCIGGKGQDRPVQNGSQEGLP